MNVFDKAIHGGGYLINRALYCLVTVGYIFLAVLSVPIKILYHFSWAIGPCLVIFIKWKEYMFDIPIGRALFMMPSAIGAGRFFGGLIISAVISMLIMFVIFRVIILHLFEMVTTMRHNLSVKTRVHGRMVISDSAKSLQNTLDSFKTSPLYRDPMMYYKDMSVSLPQS